MDRRSFLSGIISSVAAAVAGCSGTENDCETPHGSTANCGSCSACKELENYCAEVIDTEYTKDKAAEMGELLRPEIHEWSDDCHFRREIDEEHLGEVQNWFDDLTYTISSSFNRGTLTVDVSVYPPLPKLPKNAVDVTVEVDKTKT